LRQPIIFTLSDPPQRFHAVVVGRRKPVLRREAVVDGGDDGLSGIGHLDAEIMEHGGSRTEQHESASVKEKNERKLVGVGRG